MRQCARLAMGVRLRHHGSQPVQWLAYTSMYIHMDMGMSMHMDMDMDMSMYMDM